MTPIERLIKYLDKKEINDNQFTKRTGIAVGWIGSARKNVNRSITDPVYKKILDTFPDLNEAWLKAGVEPMIKEPKSKLSVNTEGKLQNDEYESLKLELEALKKLVKTQEELLEFYRRSAK